MDLNPIPYFGSPTRYFRGVGFAAPHKKYIILHPHELFGKFEKNRTVAHHRNCLIKTHEDSDEILDLHFRLNFWLNSPIKINNIAILEVSDQSHQAKLLNYCVYMSRFSHRDNFSSVDYSTSRVMKVYDKCADSDENSDENSDEITMCVYQANTGTAHGTIIFETSKRAPMDTVICIFARGSIPDASGVSHPVPEVEGFTENPPSGFV